VEKTSQPGALLRVLLTKYFSGDKIEKNEMGRPRSTYGVQERCMQGFGGANLRKSDHLS
jgi:hypothetical protein